jgi:hypothetical protein
MRQPLVTFVRQFYSRPASLQSRDQDRSERAFFPTQATLDREQGRAKSPQDASRARLKQSRLEKQSKR